MLGVVVGMSARVVERIVPVGYVRTVRDKRHYYPAQKQLVSDLLVSVIRRTLQRWYWYVLIAATY